MNVFGEPIVRRQLIFDDGSGESDVHVRMWRPVSLGEPGPSEHYVCYFAIEGLPKPVREGARGVDSLGALENAIAGVRSFLEPHREQLSYLGTPAAHGVPLIISGFAGGEADRRIEQRLSAEHERLIEELLAPKKERYAARLAELRAIYDPDHIGEDVHALSTSELLRRMREVGAAKRAAIRAEDADGVLVFGDAFRALFDALRERADATRALRAMLYDDEPALQYWGALALHGEDDAVEALERLAAGQIEPESLDARRNLVWREREAQRPKPWDEEGPAAFA